MDNLTHTLLGALAGETAARCVPTAKSLLPEATRRNLFMTLMVVGSNFPDLDALYTGITGGKLGYLLHHRGHTHTLFGALAISLTLFAACALWLRWRKLPVSAFDRWWLAFLALLAPLLHLTMDWMNEYGVHPFWPLNDAWFYGDAIFIIEPLFWAAAAPLVFLFRRLALRVVMTLVLLIGIGLAFGTGLVPPAMAFGLTAFTLLMLAVGWRCSARSAALAGLIASASVVAMFAASAQLARGRVEALAAAQYPAATALDHVLAPMPVNPLCWDVIAVQIDGDAYSLRQAVLSLAPELLPAQRCPGPGIAIPTTVTLTESTAPDSNALVWLDEVTMSRRELQDLLRNNCEAQGFARFGRALWFQHGAGTLIVGDLRYDREPGLGFAEMEIAEVPAQCPRFVPPWTPPRADLL